MQIKVVGREGRIKAQAEGSSQAVLAWEGEYEEGDQLIFRTDGGEGYFVIRADDTLDEALVYLTAEEVRYAVPFGEKRLSYNPYSFAGSRHYLTLRKAETYEVRAYRNLAKNVMDQRDAQGCYPHAAANVETRGEAVFAARNAIDGVTANLSHGRWPYQSWGINQQDDAEITVEFGRKVDIEKVVLYTRADFPHDNWWRQVTLSFSDGTSEIFRLTKKAEPHVLGVSRQGIAWIRLEQMIKADDPSPFPALTQIEVYGTESITDRE